MSEHQRKALVESLKVVDRAELGYETLDIGEVITEIKPDIIALGYDQSDMEKQVCSYINTTSSWHEGRSNWQVWREYFR